MRISKITIYNFRSIEKIENLEVNSFNVFVGQNNHGKTNFFEAIEWLYNGGSQEEIIAKGKNKDDVYVEIEFSKSQEGLSRIKTQSHKTKISKVIGDNETIRIRRKFIDHKKLLYINSDGQEVDFGIGITNALLEFLPKLQFVRTETTLKDVAKYGRKTPISEMLSEVLEQILENETQSQEYINFKNDFGKLFGEEGIAGKGLLKIGNDVKKYVNKQFQCDKVSFIPKLPTFDDIFKNITTMVNDGTETTAEEKGDGMQRALMLAIIQTYADFRRANENSKDFIFLIDEGELHLHPSAQRLLKNALLELSNNGDQILISSHSSVLISDESENQKLYKVEKIDYKTNIEEISDFDKQDVVFDLLGGSPRDLLLPNNFLIVEGESEFEFLKLVIKNHYFGETKIKILKAFGDIDQTTRLAAALNKLFTPINESIYQKHIVILLDKLSDQKFSQGAYNDFLRTFPDVDESSQIFILPVHNIEEYYPVAKQSQITAHNDVPKWQRTYDEVNNHMTSKQKVKLAKVVGNKIEKDQFEQNMLIVYKALKQCWDKAL